tara:strand:- start:176 stop:322 length:147 start_codon:yes stop_codon:yes gene_type:complete
MQKLIEKYLANPNAKLAEKIKAYEHKHPFCVCVLSPEYRQVLSTIKGV